ncbi:hypothetical protein AC578_8702 [Pseudocercospora eumusae]|uniref:Zn(2)-C6 fungal-type domain-containing protein n=1 Tax=Pseudocercospora eumusae TaxID=321146 RepID=A0A139HQ13_9PEZI|nr:hypothetical protein AC578_8702 [Pseudocercospora eumusae]
MEPSPDGEPALKRMRKGTKSCVECRQRKIRCIWQAETDSVCQGCKQRAKECVPQVYARRSVDSNRVSSKDRISRLEAQIANIAASVQHKPRHATSISPEQLGPGEGDSPASPLDSELDTVNGPTTTGPSHLKFLFDNTLIGPDQRYAEGSQERRPCSKRYADQSRAKLQHYLPTRDDVAAISSYAPPWMSLYYQLFPTTSTQGSRDQLVTKHESMFREDVDPVVLAQYLLSFAITARQVPERSIVLSLEQKGWKDIASYVQDLMQAVEHTVVAHTGLASTIEGISTTVLYLRLQLGFGAVKTLWLTLRRTIAIAELIGLPRAWYHRPMPHAASTLIDGVTDKIALWESICATDRLASMMFNLPPATATHRFPRKQIVDSSGTVLAQPYMFELAGIAMRVQELDEAYTIGSTQEEIYEKILNMDKDLRSLKSSTPISWWKEEFTFLSADALVQFWNYYLTARIHLHPAMSNDDHDQYSYSRISCVEACHALSRRYANVRTALPAGFFVCRIIDMQIFTAGTFLLLSSYGQLQAQNSDRHVFQPPQDREREDRLQSVERMVQTMEFVQNQAGSEFAREAAAALRALWSHFKHDTPTNAQGITLTIPLLGKIHIGRKDKPKAQAPTAQAQSLQSMPQTATNTQATNGDFTIPVDAQEGSMPVSSTQPEDTGTMPWLMELDMNATTLQDPFWVDDFGQFDQWMSFNNPLQL